MNQQGLYCTQERTAFCIRTNFVLPEILSERQKERVYFIGMCVLFLRRFHCDKSFYYRAQTPQKGFAVDFHYIILNRDSLVQKKWKWEKEVTLGCVGNRTQLPTSVHRAHTPYIPILFLIALLYEFIKPVGGLLNRKSLRGVCRVGKNNNMLGMCILNYGIPIVYVPLILI